MAIFMNIDKTNHVNKEIFNSVPIYDNKYIKTKNTSYNDEIKINFYDKEISEEDFH